MNNANKTTSTINPCPDCPSGSEGGVGVSLSEKPPCPGNPVPNPEIAPQKGASGIKGAMFGCTRFDSDKICEGVKGSQDHNGIDLKSAFGDPIYAMYDGTASLVTQFNKEGKVDGAGYYVEISSNINGENVKILYFHLQESNRKKGFVKAGDIIGFQGDSGNLKRSIIKGEAESHLHIKAKVNNVKVDPKTYIATKFDPNTGQITKQPICN